MRSWDLTSRIRTNEPSITVAQHFFYDSNVVNFIGAYCEWVFSPKKGGLAQYVIFNSDLSDSNQRPKDHSRPTTVLRSTNWAKVGLLMNEITFQKTIYLDMYVSLQEKHELPWYDYLKPNRSDLN